MSDYDFDIVLIGGGVVGLAVAAETAKKGFNTLVLESQKNKGSSTSARNSGVIHAGIYYPENSLKASLCVRGKHLMYEYLLKHKIKHQKLGKLIVAQAGEEEILEKIYAQAINNGVTDLKWLTKKEVSQMASELCFSEVLFSPSTGIVDTHGFMDALEGSLNDNAGNLAVFSRFSNAEYSRKSAAWKITVISSSPPNEQKTEFTCKFLINAAGLEADAVAYNIQGMPELKIPEVRFVKGNYFNFTKTCPFRNLIYPVPVPGGLGTHLTIDIGGQAQFGPDVEYLYKADYSRKIGEDNSTLDYEVNKNRQKLFCSEVKRWWPSIKEEHLSPGYSGIRPKLAKPTEGFRDFLILGPDKTALPNLIQFFGIESPGLTASLAIAEMTTEIIESNIT